MIPLFLHDEDHRLVEQLRPAWSCRRSPACSASSSCASTPRPIPDELLEAASASTAPASCGSSATIVLPLLKPDRRHARDLHFPGHLERLHVAADRAGDRRAVPRRSRWPSLSREHVQDNELMMAGSVVTVLPVLLLFLVLQRFYLQGITSGAVKG